MSLSFTTVVGNEEHVIRRLMDAVLPYVDEVVMVSTREDGTADILKQYDCQLLFADIFNGFDVARNLGLRSCTCDWVLSLDADEIPSESMLKWCRQAASKTARKFSAAKFRRDNYVDDNLRDSEYHVRLFRRQAGHWEGHIHEFIVVSGKIVGTPEDCYIDHCKTSAGQRERNELYLNFYPKLNLGSGGRPKDGWTNWDLDGNAPDAEPVDVFEELPGLPAATIYASHVLEHASYHKAAGVVHLWVEKLAPGGTIEIRVPDLACIVDAYTTGKMSYLQFIQIIYGGQTTPYDYHCTAIDEPWLTGQLKWWGCVDVYRKKTDDPFELCMVGRKPL